MMLRVVYMGTPDFAVPALEALCQDDRVEVVLVVSQPDRVAGRGKKLQRTPVAAAADAHGVPTYQPASLRDNDDAYAQLQATNADLFVVAAYGQILQQRVLDLPRHGCVNLHASLLPRWRGAAPIQWAVASGDAVTGVSLMRMELGLDTGPVFATTTTMIRAQETAGELHDRLATLSGPLLLQHLDALSDKTNAEAQNDDRSNYARMLRVDDRRVDFARSAQQVAWYINGMAPWPGARVRLQDERITLGRARPSALGVPSNAPAATVLVASAKEGLHIVAGDGRAVEILEAQRPGKRMMPAKDMLRGIELAIGATVDEAES